VGFGAGRGRAGGPPATAELRVLGNVYEHPCLITASLPAAHEGAVGMAECPDGRRARPTAWSASLSRFRSLVSPETPPLARVEPSPAHVVARAPAGVWDRPLRPRPGDTWGAADRGAAGGEGPHRLQARGAGSCRTGRQRVGYPAPSGRSPFGDGLRRGFCFKPEGVRAPRSLAGPPSPSGRRTPRRFGFRRVGGRGGGRGSTAPARSRRRTGTRSRTGARARPRSGRGARPAARAPGSTPRASRPRGPLRRAS